MASRDSQMTERQSEIKERLDRGMGAREIAEDLGISRNAVYQQIQRMRKHGVVAPGWTPTGIPAREQAPGMETLARLVSNGSQTDGDEASAAGALALVQELRRVRDELDAIARRLSVLIPR